MTWDWIEYRHLAKALIPGRFSTPRDQAIVRSVVSRAYYAVYNPAKAYAIQKGWLHASRKKVPHGDVWSAFQHRDRTEEEREIGDTGHSLMDDRHEADYERSFGCAAKICDDAIHRADQILAWLKVPPAKPPAAGSGASGAPGAGSGPSARRARAARRSRSLRRP